MPSNRDKKNMQFILSAIKRKIKVRDCLAFDVETIYDENSSYISKNKKNHEYYIPKFLCGSVYVDKKAYFFKERKDMKEFILQEKYVKYWKVATNLYYDMSMLFSKDELSEFHIVKWLFAELKITRKLSTYQRMLKFAESGEDFKYTKSSLFVDSLSYAPFMSVEKQGKLIKLPKLPKPSSFLKVPSNGLEWAEMKRYNIRDSEITGKFFYWYQKVVNRLGGELQVTAALTALNLFRRKYLKHDIWQEDKERHEFVRRAYRGGRVECFKRGTFKQDLFLYDVNSLYPYIMSKLKIPNPSSSRFVKYPSIHKIKNYLGVSEVTINCPNDMKIPLLHYNVDKKLIFPTGTFRGCYTHLELMKAQELGYKILTIHKQLVYDFYMDDLQQYSKDLYQKRCAAKSKQSPIESVLKLLMNSLYGKFSQDNNNYDETMHISQLPDNFKGRYSFIGVPDYDNGWVSVHKVDDKPKNFVHPIISCYITAGARCYMHDYLQDDNVIYTDTDSLITSKPMEDSKELGGFKLEYNIKELIVVRPKAYSYIVADDSVKTKLKGFSKLDREGFLRLLNGEIHEYTKFSKFKESIRYCTPLNSLISVRKSLRLEDSKRLWNKKFNINESQESAPLIISET